jgi:hypothetical protein
MTEAASVLLDEIHLILRIPPDLPADEAEAVRKTVAGDEFLDRLRRAVLDAVHTFPELTAVHLSLTR